MKALLSLAVVALLSTGCASLIPPSDSELARLPVIDYGKPAPADGRFVLRYPAGAELPVMVKIDGSLLAQGANTELVARVKQDVWVHGDLVSLDGSHWSRGPSVIGGRFLINPPGFGPRGLDSQAKGEMSATFDLR